MRPNNADRVKLQWVWPNYSYRPIGWPPRPTPVLDIAATEYPLNFARMTDQSLSTSVNSASLHGKTNADATSNAKRDAEAATVKNRSIVIEVITVSLLYLCSVY